MFLELQALNIIKPFTPDVRNDQMGLIASLIWNKGATKKAHQVKPSDLFPYLSNDADFLEPELYIKAKQLLQAVNHDAPNAKKQIESIKEHIQGSIDKEINKDSPDDYLIRKLKGLL